MTQRNRSSSAPLADFVDKALDPVLARQGFGQADVVLHWEEIVGERLAAFSEPLRIAWPPRAPKRDPLAPAEPATLVLQVEGAFALELQHASALIMERVNAHLGWRCIGKLQLRQGPIHARRATAPPKPRPSEATIASAARAAEGLSDEALREALTRLGAAVLTKGREAGVRKR